MAHEDIILHRTKDLQRRMFRVATDPLRYSLPLKVIAADSGIPYSTLRTYAEGSAAMPFYAFAKLLAVLPDAVTSIMVGGAGKAIITCTDEGDHDTLAATCIDFAAEHARARHPESECGVDIGPGEEERLRGKSARLKAA
ncbi:hypothetical protein [Novosphingopyxis sp. YJ-S2-01]|uniref:hypothetical protein n=1 Tax=Novosphingopyxis sp. YJ-S2-01 TaxID=2794021 RepID=UPI0018DBEC13|nr:hypothetical protein [Novosphingopyxis sp. YJ-S2-01]MBH9537504.1 hypothetical protein [Novosphingopyxis sp. YJ-S2-01]